MSKTIMVPVALALLGVAALGYEPGYRDGRASIVERQERQQDRIRDDRYASDLSKREAQRLRERSREVAEHRRQAREDDGHIDSRERRAIQHEQDELSHDIHEQSHDDDDD